MEVVPGESVTLTWTSTGGVMAYIGGKLPGNLLPQSIAIPTNGETVVKIREHERHWREFELTVWNESGEGDRQSLTVQIRCPYSFFFTPAPIGTSSCPYRPPAAVPAAEQRFEHGRMIWLKRIPAESSSSGNERGSTIFVLYEETGQSLDWQRFDDHWQSGQPESDPSIVPPEGMIQPIRGFGRLWRTNPEVRRRLGWALTNEQGYESRFQIGWRPFFLHGGIYLTLADGRVVSLGVMGAWEFVEVAHVAPSATSAIAAELRVPELAIINFSADVAEILQGRRLIFRWEKTGAEHMCIGSGTVQRFAHWWDAALDGELATVTQFSRPTLR